MVIVVEVHDMVVIVEIQFRSGYCSSSSSSSLIYLWL